MVHQYTVYMTVEKKNPHFLRTHECDLLNILIILKLLRIYMLLANFYISCEIYYSQLKK